MQVYRKLFYRISWSTLENILELPDVKVRAAAHSLREELLLPPPVAARRVRDGATGGRVSTAPAWKMCTGSFSRGNSNFYFVIDAE